MSMKESTTPVPLLTEPVPIFETFTTGIADTDDCGDFVRLTFYVDRPVVGTPAIERAVVARLIVPSGAYASVVDALAVARPEPQPRQPHHADAR